MSDEGAKYRAALVEYPQGWKVTLLKIYKSGTVVEVGGKLGGPVWTSSRWGARRVGRQMIKDALRRDALMDQPTIFIEQDDL